MTQQPKKVLVEVAISPKGDFSIRTINGTFEQGAPLIGGLAAMFKARGITFEGEFKPEQHRHDDPVEHEHEHHHAHRHQH